MTAIIFLKGELIATGKALVDSKDIITRNKGLAVKTDKAIMKKGTYPESYL